MGTMRNCPGFGVCSSLPGFRRDLCGLMTAGRRNKMDKSLAMRAWLKVNHDELVDGICIILLLVQIEELGAVV